MSNTRNTKTLFTIIKNVEYTCTVKKSIFKSYAYPIYFEPDAKKHIDKMVILCRELKATHCCWAYRLHMTKEIPPILGGDNSLSEIFRFQDDGELNGTAGKQILNALLHSNITQTIVFVIRYYGGTNLGTGGLSRSYYSSSKNCLFNSEKVIWELSIKIEASVSFSDDGTFHHALRSWKHSNDITQLIQTSNNEDISMVYQFQIPSQKLAALIEHFKHSEKLIAFKIVED